MNKTNKALDLSSIITQVPKDDSENNRSVPLTTTVAASATAQTSNGTRSKSRQKSSTILIAFFLVFVFLQLVRLVNNVLSISYSAVWVDPVDIDHLVQFILPAMILLSIMR